MFFLDVSTRFPYYGPGRVTYQLSQQHADSGLGINPSGAITGRPNKADCAVSTFQNLPLVMKVTIFLVCIQTEILVCVRVQMLLLI